jgi:hypothetical protein
MKKTLFISVKPTIIIFGSGLKYTLSDNFHTSLAINSLSDKHEFIRTIFIVDWIFFLCCSIQNHAFHFAFNLHKEFIRNK